MAEYVRDTFARTTGSGWGSATVGGAWTEALTTAASACFGNQYGRIAYASSVLSGVAWQKLASVSAADIAAASAFRVATGLASTVTFTLFARVSGAIGAPTAYAATVSIGSTGAMALQLDRRSAGTVTVLDSRSWPSTTYVVGDLWRLELEVAGTGPVDIRARVWRVADGVPDFADGWLLYQNDEAGPTTAGAVELLITRTAPAVATATIVDVDDVYVSDPPRPVFQYTVTPPTTANFTTTGMTGDPIAHAWYWGDGSAAGSTAAPISHVYPTGYWTASYHIATRWGTVVPYQDRVLVAYQPTFTRPLMPQVMIDDVDRCDETYGARWSLGAERWTDGLRGNTATIELRGRLNIAMGAPVNVALPDAAGGSALWTGTVDQVTYHVDPIDRKDTTRIVAIDTASLLGRWHIDYGTNLPLHSLSARLADLQPSQRVRYRAKWADPPAGRFPLLKEKKYKADKLRQRTYLDMIREACAASLATAYTARDGDIVYAPWNAPAGTPGTVTLDLDGTLDCPASVDFDRRSLAGMVNRWTVGDGDPIDRSARESIEKYGEQAWKIDAGVLQTEAEFPVTDGFFAAMRSPAKCPEAVIPARLPTQKALTVVPLDIARWEGSKYAVMGVRHDVSLSGWRVGVILDRNPWSIHGAVVP